MIRAYAPYDVGGNAQIWALAQDDRGVIYAGTGAAVLEYDGSNWRRIQLSLTTTVRSLAVGRDGRIYVGATRDFGYLAPDRKGQMQFVSLLDKVPPDARDFDATWRTLVTRDGIVFQTERTLYRWDGQKFTLTRADSRFGRASEVDGQVYLVTPEHGLNVIDHDTVRALPGTAALANEPYPIVLRYDESKLLIGTRANGVFLYDGTSLSPFPTELDAVWKSGQMYRGINLPNGTFALTTTSGGMGIIDRQGRRIAQANRAVGLPSDVVYFPMRDAEGALWLGLDSGIARVETPSPLSFLSSADGLPGGGFSAIRSGGRLYLSMQTGVHHLVPASGSGLPHFAPVTHTSSSQCWSFAELKLEGRRDPALVVACGEGLYEIKGTEASPIKVPGDLSFVAFFVLQSRVDPNRLWVSLRDGLSSFAWQHGRWVDEGRVPGVSDAIRFVFENPDGSLWLGTEALGARRLRFEQTPSAGQPRPAVAGLDRFGTGQGLPEGGVNVLDVKGHPYFAVGTSDPYVARFDAATNRFVRMTEFDGVGVDPIQGGTGAGVLATPDGRVYVNFGRETVVFTQGTDGRWTADRHTFARFGSRQPPGLLYPDANGIVWMQLPDQRLVRYDTTSTALPDHRFAALVRRATINEKETLFEGAGQATAPPRLDAASNALRFEFAAPDYVAESALEFQSQLQGLDRDWSEWSHDSRREYTNLGFGDYRFRVHARNVLGQLSQEASYAFVILPPWYRTWWAYALYASGLFLLVVGADRIQRRRVVRKERERAQFVEAKLRAEAAEQLAESESENKKNIELLSEIGRELTSTLDIETIFNRLYDHVNELADAEILGVGLYVPERNVIDYRLAIERGKRYAPYTRDTTDTNQLPVWCLEHREPVFINDVDTETTKYITGYDEERRPLEDGTLSEKPGSIIYMPLINKDKVLGIVTIQSFKKHAYTEHHLNLMRSLASYTSIAIDNAAAYRRLNQQEAENRRLFEEAEKARAVAEEADAAKSAFLSTVSHELRTPLTSVLGFAKIIKKRLEDRIFPLVPTDDRKVVQTIQQVHENLAVVVSEGERLTKLIDDVLDLAKIEAGKLEWHMEPVGIEDVIDRATAATSSLFEQKGLRLVKDVGIGLPIVTGDRDRLIQVVINLISNAVKFTDAGSVTCRAEERGGAIVVSVIDTGLGIAPADQPKVFERFKQVGDTLTDKPKGTGLGLPICKEIVEHHGGQIWVDSDLGTGSTFAFSLPVTAAKGEPRQLELEMLMRQLRQQVAVAAPARGDGQPSILVVDDDPNIRELLNQEFSENGFVVRMAANGREAIAEVRRERPDLIVLDVMMPEMNGFDVAAVLKNDPATQDIPIIILSIVQDRDRGFRLGVDRYLTKPIDTSLLFREVDTLLAQRTSHKRVLVVDEDASTVKTLSDVLTARGYHVTEANGADMLEKAVAVQPDIIILSTMLSEKHEAVQSLRFEKGLENVVFVVYQ